MELGSYGRQLYRFYGKIYLLLMIGYRDEQGFKSRFENKYKATINQNKEDYLQLKNDFGNISQELSKDEDHLLAGIAQLFDNLDTLFLDITYENTVIFVENRDSITALESWDLYADTFKKS